MALSTYITTMVHSQTLREHGTLHIHYHYGPQSDFTGTWHSPHTLPLWSTVRLYGNMALSTYITTMVHSQTLRNITWQPPHCEGNMALSTYITTMVHSQTLRNITWQPPHCEGTMALSTYITTMVLSQTLRNITWQQPHCEGTTYPSYGDTLGRSVGLALVTIIHQYGPSKYFKWQKQTKT